MNIGENLKRLRKNSNLTQKDLADILGVTTVTIQNYENNRRTPNTDMLVKISLALNIPFAKFVNEVYSGYTLSASTGAEFLKANYILTGNFDMNDEYNGSIEDSYNKNIQLNSSSNSENLFNIISEFINSSTSKNIDTKKITLKEKEEIITKIIDLFEFEVFKLNKK